MNTSLYEDGYNEGVRVSDEKIKSLEQKSNAFEQENKEVRERIVKNMRSKGFSDEEINNLTEFSLDDIKSI